MKNVFAIAAATAMLLGVTSATAAVVYHQTGSLPPGACNDESGDPPACFDSVRIDDSDWFYGPTGSLSFGAGSFRVELNVASSFPTTIDYTRIQYDWGYRYNWWEQEGELLVNFLERATGTETQQTTSTRFIAYFRNDPHFDSRYLDAGGHLVGEEYDEYSWLNFVISTEDTRHPLSYELTVTSVPEPETWALMLLGLGVAGHSLRRRRAGRSAAMGFGDTILVPLPCAPGASAGPETPRTSAE